MSRGLVKMAKILYKREMKCNLKGIARVESSMR